MGLTAADFEAWADRHGAMFGFAGDRDAATFAAWYEVFALCGYTAAELRGATDAIAVRGEPLKWRDDHLAAIHAHVRGLRRVGEAQARLRCRPEDTGEVGTCDLCGDGGLVVVPHPAYVLGGEWSVGPLGRKPTAAVYCRCWKGRDGLAKWNDSSAEFQRAHPRMFTLDEYEAKKCRGWRELLAAEESASAAVRKASVVAQVQDKAAGPLPVGKVLAGLKVAPEVSA